MDYNGMMIYVDLMRYHPNHDSADAFVADVAGVEVVGAGADAEFVPEHVTAVQITYSAAGFVRVSLQTS